MNRFNQSLAIYVHIPFCQKKCPYCDFFSRIKNSQEIDLFVQSLISEVENSPYRGRKASTLFLGGGTPSLLDTDQIGNILASIRNSFDWGGKGETPTRAFPERTIECNPGTLSPALVDKLIEQGINRFSLGAQSFQDFNLRLLGRIHTLTDTVDSYHLLRRKGVSNVSLDLIYGLPGQNLKQWEKDLESAIELSPEHLSVYGLTIEPNTEYGRLYELGQIILPGEDLEAEMYEITLDILESNGFQQYEISNFALPGFECHHNLAYWTGSEYLGFGPSAASFIAGTRWTNTSDWLHYTDTASKGSVLRDQEESLDGIQAFTEELVISLRLNKGADIESLSQKHNISLNDSLLCYLTELKKQSIVAEFDSGVFSLTTKGKLLASEISVRLMQILEKDL